MDTPSEARQIDQERSRFKIPKGSRGSHGFDVEVLYDDGGEELRELRIVGSISKSYPAVMYLPNGDPGYPAEGGEIEEYRVFERNGNGVGVSAEERKRSDWTEIDDSEGKIIDAVMDDVYEKASEDAAGDECDAADYRRDCREDR